MTKKEKAAWCDGLREAAKMAREDAGLWECDGEEAIDALNDLANEIEKLIEEEEKE